VGDHCERCDLANHYSPGLLTVSSHANTNSGVPANWTVLPTCYYDLQLDFQFTFNLSKKEDRHIKQINFRNVPLKPDLDLEFSVQCSTLAKLNISVRSAKVVHLRLNVIVRTQIFLFFLPLRWMLKTLTKKSIYCLITIAPHSNRDFNVMSITSAVKRILRFTYTSTISARQSKLRY
jgi:hypothetical protein